MCGCVCCVVCGCVGACVLRLRLRFRAHAQVLAYSSGASEPHKLSRVAFDKLMNRVMSGNAGSVCALQAEATGTKYRVTFHRSPGDGGPSTASWKTLRIMDDGSAVGSRAGKVNAVLAESAARVIQHIEDVQHVRVRDLTAEFMVGKKSGAPVLTHVPTVMTVRLSPGAETGTVVPLLAMKRDREALQNSARSTRLVDGSGDGDGDGTGMWASASRRPGTGSSAGGRRGGSGGLGASASLPALTDGGSGVRCVGAFCGCRVERVDTGVFAVRRPRSQVISVRPMQPCPPRVGASKRVWLCVYVALSEWLWLGGCGGGCGRVWLRVCACTDTGYECLWLLTEQRGV